MGARTQVGESPTGRTNLLHRFGLGLPVFPVHTVYSPFPAQARVSRAQAADCAPETPGWAAPGGDERLGARDTYPDRDGGRPDPLKVIHNPGESSHRATGRVRDVRPRGDRLDDAEQPRKTSGGVGSQESGTCCIWAAKAQIVLVEIPGRTDPVRRPEPDMTSASTTFLSGSTSGGAA